MNSPLSLPNDTESEAELCDLGQRYLYPNYRQPALVFVRGQGSELWDRSGKR